MEEHLILTTVAAAVGLGITAQVLAERFKIPAILPLLALGMLAGPSAYGLGWVHPEALGHGLDVFVHLGVAIILFEGGLSLDLRQLARVGTSVGNLLTIGVVVTGVGAAYIAHVATGIPWSIAALFGAIVTVTGPTVIAPLLRHMIAPREVKTVLLSEGLIIDAIGAVLAYLVLQWIERAGVPFKDLAADLVILFITGAVLGFVAGAAARWLSRSRLCSGELRNLVVLAILVLLYLAAEHQAPQSGILAAVVMGMTVSGSDIPDLVPLKVFKGQLTTLFISVLFVLLSAQLDINAMINLGYRGLAVVFGLILIIRPLAVFLSVWQAKLGMKERFVLAMTAPRGIVAAAVVSLAARQLTAQGFEGGRTLEALVYLTILITGAWATVAAVILPRLLGYRRDPSRRLTVLIGANPLSEALAGILESKGRTTAIVDSSLSKLNVFRRTGVRTFRGDARNAATYEDVGVEADTVSLAMTPNDELNLVVADLLREEFHIEHPVVVLQNPSDEFGTRRRAWIDLLGGQGVDLPRWIRRLEAGKARLLTLSLKDSGDARQRVRELLRDQSNELVPICGWKDSNPSFSKVVANLNSLDAVTFLVTEGEAEHVLTTLVEEQEELVEEAEVGSLSGEDDSGEDRALSPA